MRLREWQTRALEALAHHTGRDFLVSATPGAGKTTLALSAAGMLSNIRGVRRVVVVTHTDSLRQQWCGAASQRGIHLIPVRAREDLTDSKGYHGWVLTYQQLASRVWASRTRGLISRHPTLVIPDEIHHAGESKAWGDGLEHAFNGAEFRLCLTGTPWRRSPKERIPFVQYSAGGQVLVDYQYSYTDALRDGVCRPVEFVTYTGDVSWVDSGVRIEARLNEYLPEEDLGIALKTAFDPRNDWVGGVLRDACGRLEHIRQTIPDAGGLVVAGTQRRAREYAKMLQDLTGEPCAVVLSDDGQEGREALRGFRGSRARWLCAVSMISEGVDIPRLLVGCYLTNIRTPLYFRQTLGRIVRKRPGEEATGVLFMPQVQPLVGFAEEIEKEIRHQLEEETEEDEEPREREGVERRASLKFSDRAGDAQLGRVFVAGQPVEISWAPAAQESAPEIPRYDVERALRKKLDHLVKKTAARIPGKLGENVTRLNSALKRRYGARASADVETLEGMIKYLESR